MVNVIGTLQLNMYTGYMCYSNLLHPMLMCIIIVNLPVLVEAVLNDLLLEI